MGVSCNKILPVTAVWQPRILTKSCIDWGLWSIFDLPAEEAQPGERINLECTVSVSSIIWPCRVISFFTLFSYFNFGFYFNLSYKIQGSHMTFSYSLILVNPSQLSSQPSSVNHITPSLHFNLLISLCIPSPLFYQHCLKNTLFPPDVLFVVPGFQGSKLRKWC